MVQIHATCIDLDGDGVLLRGPSGSGKSDLALRLIGRGARLVADDRCILHAAAGRLLARAPERLSGLLEVRGLGLAEFPTHPQAAVTIVVDLVPADSVVRLPDPQTVSYCGLDRPLYRLAAFEASVLEKIVLAVQIARGQQRLRV